MSDQGAFDWYALSKLSLQKPQLQSFHKLVTSGDVSTNIHQVSHTYRKKILQYFQECSLTIKKESIKLERRKWQMEGKKRQIVAQLSVMQEETQNSFKEIQGMRLLIAQKKRMATKFKEKIVKSRKKGGEQYYCPFCARNDFTTRQTFSFHMLSEHPVTRANPHTAPQPNSDSNSDLKDFIMTLKDKQMELMSMILREKREMKTQELEKIYDLQLKKFMATSGAGTEAGLKVRESMEEEDEQLKGESKFLFFQKSQQYKRELIQDNEFKSMNRDKLYEKGKKQLSNEFYERGNYYQIFGRIQQNVSENMQDSSRKLQIQIPSGQNLTIKQVKSYGYYDPNEFLSRFIKNQEISKDSSYTLKQQLPKPYIEIKDNSIHQSIYIAPSISDRLKQNLKKDPKYDTVFSTKNKNYQGVGYIFNSGPLLDDKGGDSDYEDYFGPKAKINEEIEDEEIKAPYRSLKSDSRKNASRDEINLSKLLSPKQGNSQFLQKQKSSVIVDLSDSFSRKDFELSKDESSINLSDLKLSKLQKKRQQEKITKPPIHQIRSQQPIMIQQEEGERGGMNRQEEVRKIQFLKQFQRKKVIPLVQSNYKFEQFDYDSSKIPLKQRVSIISPNELQIGNTIRKRERNPDILSEFFKKSASVTEIAVEQRTKLGLDEYMRK